MVAACVGEQTRASARTSRARATPAGRAPSGCCKPPGGSSLLSCNISVHCYHVRQAALTPVRAVWGCKAASTKTISTLVIGLCRGHARTLLPRQQARRSDARQVVICVVLCVCHVCHRCGGGIPVNARTRLAAMSLSCQAAPSGGSGDTPLARRAVAADCSRCRKHKFHFVSFYLIAQALAG